MRKLEHDDFDRERVEKALWDSYGILKWAAASLNVHVSTLRKYLKNEPRLAAKAAEIQESLKDDIERLIIEKALHQGDWKALDKLSKAKCRDRGYGDEQAIDLTASHKHEVRIDEAVEALKKALEREIDE
jgi:hypothetical protein